MALWVALVLLAVSLAMNGLLWQHVRVVEKANRDNNVYAKRDELTFRYGQLSRRDFESLGISSYELLGMVGGLNYTALMNGWYGQRPRGHYIARAMSDGKAAGRPVDAA